MRQLRIPTTLKVVNGLDTVTPTTRTASEAAQQAQANLALASRSWGTLSDLEQLQWNSAASLWGPKVGLPSNGASVYKSLVLTKLLMGSDIAFARVPDVPDAAPATPDFSLEATVTDTGVFTLKMLSDGATGPFLLAATPSQSRGTSRFVQSRYRVLDIYQSLGEGLTDITSSFEAVFLLKPSLGTKIAVQVTSLTANGFRGLTVTRNTVVKAATGLSVTE